MILQKFLRIAASLTLLGTAMVFVSEDAGAQVIDFSQIDAFESMGTGTLHGASQPKTIVDDGERHTVFITIWKLDNLGSAESSTITATRLPVAKFSVRSGTSQIEK
jgi:hypothetical protein